MVIPAETFSVATRMLGRKRRLLEDWSIVPPVMGGHEDGGGACTLRQLITHVVCESVAAFEKRQEQHTFVRVLSSDQIQAQLAKGKVDSGGRPMDASQKPVDVERAIANALLAFEDGLYLVILDGHEQRDLDAQVFLKPDSQMTFLRLVMLAGA